MRFYIDPQQRCGQKHAGGDMKRFGMVLLLFCIFLAAAEARASEIDQERSLDEIQQAVEQALFGELGFEEIDEALETLFPEGKMEFGETVKAVAEGKLPLSFETVGKFVKEQLFYEFSQSKKSLVYILMLAVAAAVFANFSGIFPNRQIAEISFYLLYLLLFTVCLNGFRVMTDFTAQRLGLLTSFMKVLGPVYFLAVAVARGSVTSIAFYNLVLFLIFLVELLILNVLLPFVQVYTILELLDHLSSEEYLSKMAELIHTGISWSIRTLLACVIGLNLIQGMLLPVIDSVKRGVVAKTAEAIPGVGDAIGGMAEVVLGTTVLVKNSIGITGAVICVGICAVPFLQVAVISFLYKLVAAVIQPVSDERIVGCVSGIGKGYELLLKIIFTTGLLFLLTIAVVTTSTT